MNLEAAARRIWQSRNVAAALLWPLSQAYRVLFEHDRRRRRALARPLPVPVIVVGNAVAGGAGKTPVVIALVRHLQSQGWRPGVISRGYGRAAQGGAAAVAVRGDSDPALVGDEPLLIHRHTGAPTWVAQRRWQALEALRQAAPDINVVVSDDGLQHHELQATVRICIWDRDGLGNGWLLPAGPLREPWPLQADFFLSTDATAPGGPAPAFRITRRIAAEAIDAHGRRMALRDLARAGPVQVWTAIARPARFLADLAVAGVVPQATHVFRDHYDFQSMNVSLDDSFAVVCTEKDAVKLWRRLPSAWAVPLALEIEPTFWPALDAKLRPLSSRHGSEAA